MPSTGFTIGVPLVVSDPVLAQLLPKEPRCPAVARGWTAPRVHTLTWGGVPGPETSEHPESSRWRASLHHHPQHINIGSHRKRGDLAQRLHQCTWIYSPRGVLEDPEKGPMMSEMLGIDCFGRYAPDKFLRSSKRLFDQPPLSLYRLDAIIVQAHGPPHVEWRPALPHLKHKNLRGY
ncbi:hypothetical protein BD779DRAFT_1566455 [Infundibulicybe gibba]|nr:hypothetical protein BD779DRAFT_1566455 [Infundibulicybe gibba]